MNIDFILNGEDVSIKTDPVDCLTDILRDQFKLKSIASDCRIGVCGKCIVFMNGRLVNSCLIPAFKLRSSEIITYEGFISTSTFIECEKAFAQTDIEFCGSCDKAYTMALGSLLDSITRPLDSVIEDTMSSVYCRCATPSVILRAVKAAVESRFGGKYSHAR